VLFVYITANANQIVFKCDKTVYRKNINLSWLNDNILKLPSIESYSN